MLERMISALVLLAGGLIGAGLISSRRTRLRRKIEDQLRLAEILEAHDPLAAAALRSLAVEGTRLLLETDHDSLTRRFEPWSIFAGLLFIAPGVAAVVWGGTRGTWWGWLLAVVGGLWIVASSVATWQTAWKSHGAQEEEARDDADVDDHEPPP